ncbi:ATP-dependent DNA ligase [Microbacterium sp. NPDC088619]|uniref:DUF7882 family protein n=1 Tax=Microbacterium sp. NPDC088619 TaxID=3364196 RepID=UPI003820E3E8
MGRFVYEGSQKAEIDDRTLHHLQVVVTTKLRRSEPFLFTWRDDSSVGGGRSTVWLHPGCSLVFSYSVGQVPDLNRQWIEALAFTANAPSGLYVVREPDGRTGSESGGAAQPRS